MRQFFLGATAMAVACALGATMFMGANAGEPAGGFTQCAVMQTSFAAVPATVDSLKDGLVPKGWTPIGGTAVPKGMKYIGAVTICK